MSYGIAFIIIIISLAVMYKTGLLNPTLAPVFCTATSAFACGQFSINAVTGVLTMQISQSTGGPITVNAIACASARNASADRPQYGNPFVTNAAAYYPAGWSPNPANTFYSGTTVNFEMYCYGPGGIATGKLGNAFYGYVWINYSTPNYGTTNSLSIIKFTGKYT